jgi:hypothetical protein
VQQKTTNDYFLRSAGNISFFLEEKAFTGKGFVYSTQILSSRTASDNVAGWKHVGTTVVIVLWLACAEDGKLRQEKERSVNKIGHGEAVPLRLAV